MSGASCSGLYNVIVCSAADSSSAVAEARASSERKLLYASPEGLGQTFSDDILACNFSRDDFKATIDQSVRDATSSGTSTTWVFSSHDVSASMASQTPAHSPGGPPCNAIRSTQRHQDRHSRRGVWGVDQGVSLLAGQRAQV